MKQTLLAASAALVFGVIGTSPAQAACSTNPAICKAICGCTCCTTQTGCGGTGGFKLNTGREASAALKGFSTTVLQSEMEASRNDAVLQRTLKAVIAERK